MFSKTKRRLLPGKTVRTALFQPKSHRIIFQAGLLAWPATAAAFSRWKSAMAFEHRRKKSALQWR
jgi:hypothetical protein